MSKIYIDAGHGGEDVGAVGIGGIKESTITLAVAKYLQAELKRQDFDVKMSRTSDITKSLNERAKEANKYGADIVISVHCNAFDDPSAHGTETYVYQYGYKSSLIAKEVQASLVSELGTKNRGVKEGNLAMVRDTDAPAILVELAFITNKNDCTKVDNAGGQKKCAISICKGICKYFGVTYREEKEMANKTKFKDENKMSSWAVDAIRKVSEAGIMNGDPNGKFRPKDCVSREELAVVVAKLLK